MLLKKIYSKKNRFSSKNDEINDEIKINIHDINESK